MDLPGIYLPPDILLGTWYGMLTKGTVVYVRAPNGNRMSPHPRRLHMSAALCGVEQPTFTMYVAYN